MSYLSFKLAHSIDLDLHKETEYNASINIPFINYYS